MMTWIVHFYFPLNVHFYFTIYRGYTHNAQKIRIAGMFFNSPLWIIYDLIIGSWAGAIDELASIISAMISIRRYGWKNLNQIDD